MHSERVEGDRSRSGAVSPDGGPKTTRTARTLEPSQVARMRAALAGVLRGGPYRAEYPPPEGVSCRLALQLAGQPAFFTIDKARRLEKDEVNALIALLAGQP